MSPSHAPSLRYTDDLMLNFRFFFLLSALTAGVLDDGQQVSLSPKTTGLSTSTT